MFVVFAQFDIVLGIFEHLLIAELFHNNDRGNDALKTAN